MSTPHNKANVGDIAKTVLMPGDPLRAKYIAEEFLDNVVCFNTVRNMFGYTGTYKGKPLSVRVSKYLSWVAVWGCHLWEFIRMNYMTSMK